MAGWIKMPLGMEVGLDPGDFVLVANPVPLPKKGAEPPICGTCLLWPNGWMDQDATWHGGGPRSSHIVLDGDPAPLPKRGQSSQFSAHVYSGQTAGWAMMTLGTEAGLGPGHIVVDGDPAPPR